MGKKGLSRLCAGTLPAARIIVIKDALRKPLTGLRLVAERVDGVDMAAEPVPVRRPGVRIDAEPLVEVSIASATGSTNIGLNLNARYTTSTHEIQFETIKSPALGENGSFDGASRPRLRTTCSTGIQTNPRMNNASRHNMEVRIPDTNLCKN